MKKCLKIFEMTDSEVSCSTLLYPSDRPMLILFSRRVWYLFTRNACGLL